MQAINELQLKPLAVRPSTAARLLDCGRTYIYGLIQRGEIRTIPFGDGQRILMAELEAYLAAKQAQSAGGDDLERACDEISQ